VSTKGVIIAKSVSGYTIRGICLWKHNLFSKEYFIAAEASKTVT